MYHGTTRSVKMKYYEEAETEIFVAFDTANCRLPTK